MIRLFINNRSFFVKKNISILEACKFIGIIIPRFCFHENLSIAGNCRMCLVETDKSPKPIAACAAPVMENLFIFTKGPRVLKSRENVLEILLLNHPLDCPICDQGGECDLQEQAQVFGTQNSRSYLNKRSVEDKYCGVLIKTIMNRCIHCTRCVRFGSEIMGTFLLGTLNRGKNTEIGAYIIKISTSPFLSNIVDLCPVGALTLKTSAFLARPWELKSLDSIDLTDGLGSNIYINYKEVDLVKISPKKNFLLNESWISDKGRFAFDALIYQRLQVKPALLEMKLKNLFFFLASNRSTKLLFLITKELGFSELNLLKQLEFVSKSKLKVKLFSNQKKISNYYLWGSNKTISEITTIKSTICLFISCNVNVEASLLNIRLKTKFLTSEFKFFSLGNFFTSSYSVSFLRFGASEAMSLFGCKNLIISKLFLKVLNPIVMSGKSFTDRFNSFGLNDFLKKNASILHYTIFTQSNEESLNYLNFTCYNSKQIRVSKQLYFVNLADSVNLRYLVLSTGFKSISFASHTSELIKYLLFTFGIFVSQETGGLYLNLEQRPQLVTPFQIKKLGGVISLLFFFNALLNIFNPNLTNNFFSKRNSLEKLFSDIIVNSKLFMPSRFIANLLLGDAIVISSFKVNVYPFKLLIEDYLRTNNFTKFSKVLLLRSREVRKLENSFLL